ncbi:hypothetical protein GOP47_0014075 [Adiantum capillus-veneris]|uniref:Uncharacterized protein n=1 Tax=Adiantum capillus-veneris TaxID=13818 RepID=A0A9D4UPR1_ADICA|nr:hypothetical protein GOP47_0014075 [Adiantum capillus-veneris]
MERILAKKFAAIKRKRPTIGMVSKAQVISNKRAIEAEAAMNKFLANPLAGMPMPGSAQAEQIKELRKSLETEKISKGLLVNRFHQQIEDKDKEISEVKAKLTKLRDLMVTLEIQQVARQVQPTPVVPLELPTYMERVDFDMPGPG